MCWRNRAAALLAPLCLLALAPVSRAAETVIDGRLFRHPDGMVLEKAAGPPLIQRPICADFDPQGRLYVAESSGSNAAVEQQRAERPHTIIRLEDLDGDGHYDRRTTFADHMMLPEGALWYDGSLYVAAPPEIWKLTDTDDDGRADRREVWMDGKTLTHCANDLHGPYLGPDGWIYWCKGAFAKQTHALDGGGELVTRAAHIFRRRPEGGPVEVVMTGGMDNPVEVVFTPAGEPIFTTTFLQHPAGGHRDGLIHAVYGGLYGKDHDVLEGHPRTGELMPVLVHMGAAAPAGLARLESGLLDPQWRGNLVAASFNLHQIFRYELAPQGGTYQAKTSELVASDDLDFHPTDVLEDADGSLLIIDTGGWYKLCCPTSQLWKPDVLGGIYRLRRSDGPAASDPRGEKLEWPDAAPEVLVERLADPRPVVRRRAADQLVAAGGRGVDPLSRFLQVDTDASLRCAAAWVLERIGSDPALAALRQALDDSQPQVRHAAALALGRRRDGQATSELIERLSDPSPMVRRAAAEALGRIKDRAAVEPLLLAASETSDRVVGHALTYALLEIGHADPIVAARDQWRHDPARATVALWALEQIDPEALVLEDLIEWLGQSEPAPREAAWWVLQRHPEWDRELVAWLRPRLEHPGSAPPAEETLRRLFTAFHRQPSTQALMGEILAADDLDPSVKTAVLETLTSPAITLVPESWTRGVALHLEPESPLVEAAIEAAAALMKSGAARAELAPRLADLAGNAQAPPTVRLHALAAYARRNPSLATEQLEQLLDALGGDQPASHRSWALASLEEARLAPDQLTRVAARAADASPLDLPRLIRLFHSSRGDSLAALKQLIARLSRRPDLPPSVFGELRQVVPADAEALQAAVAELEAQRAPAHRDSRQLLDRLLAELPTGDVRRGQQVFHGTRAACSSCHAMGYLGGTIGPDLTRIGQLRSRTDLLESILFPSLSFVQSFEPVTVETEDGRIYSGLLREDGAGALALIRDATTVVRLARTDIASISPSAVSIMPSGLGEILTRQELADLLAFLEAAR